MRTITTTIAIIACVLSLTACSSKKAPNNDEKSRLANLSSTDKNSAVISDMRAQILRDTALSVGARGGLAWRSRTINEMLSKQEKQLDRLFNFSALVVEQNVLPPVLSESRKTLNLASNETIRIADINYKIIAQAKFITRPPIWRDYLWMSNQDPETPDNSLLPRNNDERKIWEKYIIEGWDAGMGQAVIMYKENMSRLQRDYEGMIRYHRLLKQGMVSPPFVANLELGVTGNDSNMAVNDRILRITALPSLQADSQNWKTEIIPH